MHKDYWKMSDEELEQLARKRNLRGFFEKTFVLTNDREMDTGFVINRRDVIEQLSQRDNRNIAFWSAIVAVLGAVISLFVNFYPCESSSAVEARSKINYPAVEL